jgi:hypothetical protein
LKITEWFACLSFSKIDILLPRDTIRECRYDAAAVSDTGNSGDSVLLVNLDQILKKNLGLPVPDSVSCILIVTGIHDYAVQTGVSPRMMEIELAEFRPVSGLTGSFLLRSGIIAFRFLQNRIQYAVDIQKIVEKAGADT